MSTHLRRNFSTRPWWMVLDTPQYCVRIVARIHASDASCIDLHARCSAAQTAHGSRAHFARSRDLSTIHRVWEDDSRPRLEQIGWWSRTEHFARGEGSAEKRRQSVLHETEAGRLLSHGNTRCENGLQHGQLGTYISSPLEYLIRIASSYLEDRTLIVETEGGSIEVKIAAGVAQGSVGGPRI